MFVKRALNELKVEFASIERLLSSGLCTGGKWNLVSVKRALCELKVEFSSIERPLHELS